jgi:hypothetical protein
LPLVEAFDDETIAPADIDFNSANGIPANPKLCPRGSWNERILLKITLSMVMMVFGSKRAFHRVYRYFETRLAYIAAIFGMLPSLNRSLNQETDPQDRPLHIAQYAL